jgi:hypothetical protein
MRVHSAVTPTRGELSRCKRPAASLVMSSASASKDLHNYEGLLFVRVLANLQIY